MSPPNSPSATWYPRHAQGIRAASQRHAGARADRALGLARMSSAKACKVLGEERRGAGVLGVALARAAVRAERAHLLGGENRAVSERGVCMTARGRRTSSAVSQNVVESLTLSKPSTVASRSKWRSSWSTPNPRSAAAAAMR